MAQIGTVWDQQSWVSLGGWSAGTWAAAVDTPCGPVGTVWIDGSWQLCVWVEDAWGNTVPVICDYPDPDSVLFGVVYAQGALTGTFQCPTPPPPDPSLPGNMPYAAIEANIVYRVRQALNMPAAFVMPVASDSYVLSVFENLFAVVRSYGPSPINPVDGSNLTDDGAGRWRTVVGRRFRVYIYIRSGVDTVGDDTIALEGADPGQLVTTPPTMPGIYALEEVVLNALQNYVITYVDEDDVVRPLTIGPVKWIDSADGPPVRPPEEDVGIVRSHLDFWVQYTLAIQLTEPAPDGLPVPNPGN